MDELYKTLEMEVDNLSGQLARGAPKDFAEYKYLQGKIEGFLWTQKFIRDLQTEDKEDDDVA